MKRFGPCMFCVRLFYESFIMQIAKYRQFLCHVGEYLFAGLGSSIHDHRGRCKTELSFQAGYN